MIGEAPEIKKEWSSAPNAVGGGGCLARPSWMRQPQGSAAIRERIIWVEMVWGEHSKAWGRY